MPEETDVQESAHLFEERVREAFEAIGYRIEESHENQEFDFVVSRYEFPFEIRALAEVKYFESSLVPASTVYRYLDMVQRYGLDKAIIVTTLGFAEDSNKLARESNGKIVLLTETELIGQIPGKRMNESYSAFLKSNYMTSSLKRYLELTKPDYRNLISRLPKNRLLEMVIEYASPQDLADLVAEKVPEERILELLKVTIKPTQIREILVSLAKKTRIPISRKKEIEQEYNQAKISNDPNQKGKLFEKVVKEVFELVPGLKFVDSNVDDGIEEIDIQLRNHNQEDIWAEFEGMIFIECKNWSRPADTHEIDGFTGKLTRNGLHSGIFVALVGVTGSSSKKLEGAWGAIKMYLQQGYRIVVLDGKDLEDILRCADISERVDEKYQQLYRLGSPKAGL